MNEKEQLVDHIIQFLEQLGKPGASHLGGQGASPLGRPQKGRGASLKGEKVTNFAAPKGKQTN
jgi:hypothetical protein